MIYCHNHNNTTKKKDERRLLYKYMYLSLYCKGSKRVTQGLRVRGSWRPNRNCNILAPTLMAVNVVSFLFSWCSTGGPGPLWWVMVFFTASYQHLLWTPTHQGPNGPFGLMWLSLKHVVYNSVRSLTATNLTSLLTELYNSSTSTQSPTRFLKLHVWSSSSGNNCHAVYRSLSSGASVYECTMGIFFFTSSHFISQFPPTRFPLITAIRMCHFLPMHHLGMAFLAGSQVKIQQYYASVIVLIDRLNSFFRK